MSDEQLQRLREIGARITAAREAKGMTQSALAREAGLSPSGISMIESGDRECLVGTLAKIASVLGVSEATLLGETSLDPEGEILYKNYKGLSPAHQQEINQYMAILKNKQSSNRSRKDR